MTPVTDPNILSQLNSSSGLKPVTDPNVLAQLNGNQQSQSAIPGANYLPSGIRDVLSGMATGGQNINQFLTNNVAKPIVNMFSPSLASKLNAPQINPDQMFGVNNPDLIDKLTKGLAQYSPLLPLAGAGAATQIAAGAGYGATQLPNNPIMGATLGGATAAIPGAVSGASKLLDAFRPQKYAEQMMAALSGGKTLEQNAQSLAQDIRNGFQQRVAQGTDMYSPVFNSAGKTDIYAGVNQQETRAPVDNFKNIGDVMDYMNDQHGVDLNSPKELKDFLQDNFKYSFKTNDDLLKFFNSYPTTVNAGKYSSLDGSIIDSYDRNLNNLHQQFTENPTLQNAHDLQSQLGTAVRKLQYSDTKGNLSVADRNTMQGYQQAQGALRSDIGSFLNNQSPGLASQYENATNNWLTNVVPYVENSKIAPIAKGDITNPSNIASIFKNPEPEVQKVAQDLGPNAQNKILYSQLGKLQPNLSPESLATGINSLDKNGLGSYVTPSLQQQLKTLGGKMAARDLATLGQATRLGKIYKAIPNTAPLSQFGQGVSSGASASYPYLSEAILANILNGRQQ